MEAVRYHLLVDGVLSNKSTCSIREFVSTVTSKGPVMLPAEVRRHLGIKTRDKVAFVIDKRGKRNER